MLAIGGSICALATPYRADGVIDLAAFGRLLDHQLDGGTQAVVVAGSTGEAHLLEGDEFERLLGFALEHVAGRGAVIYRPRAAGPAARVPVPAMTGTRPATCFIAKSSRRSNSSPSSRCASPVEPATTTAWVPPSS
jgi:hypothetical protein